MLDSLSQKNTTGSHCLESRARQKTSWSYQTKMYAYFLLLLHSLFKTRMKFKLHWAKPLIENTKELAILLPITQTLQRTVLVGVIYREGCHVWMKQFQELNGKVMLPFKIGTYYKKTEQEQRDMLH
jgi:hypothetical protein